MQKKKSLDLSLILQGPKSISSENVLKLFHYTHDSKKISIVGENRVVFQLSRVDEFLDKNEGVQILEPYYHACGQLYEDGTINKTFYEQLIGIKQKDLFDKFVGSWVLCFSKNGNSIFLKRRYAAGNGWILGINFDYLDDIAVELPEEYGYCYLYEVKYSLRGIVREFRNALKKYYTHYVQHNSSNNGDSVKQDIVEWLCQYSLIYKNQDYKSEEEIRLVCKFKSDFSVWEDTSRGIKFETSINGYSPMVKMILDKRHLIYETQKIDVCFDTKLNKSMLCRDEIQKVFKKWLK